MREQGLIYGNTAAYDYMNKIAAYYEVELIPMQSCSPEQKSKRKEILKYSYVSRKEVVRFLWMGYGLNDAQRTWIFEKYPVVFVLYTCIHEFREIFREGRQSLMVGFIEKYRSSGIKLLERLAKSFEKDIDAILNSVSSPLSTNCLHEIDKVRKICYNTSRDNQEAEEHGIRYTA